MKKWWIMATVAIGVFLSTIDGSIVNVALPTLASELHAPFAAVQWVVLAYLLTLVTLMMVMGRLADIRGKRQLYAVGFVVFTVGSLFCGISPDVGWLVAARVLQGVGASTLMALGAAIATEAFPPKERGRAMGLIGMMVSIGLISGPTLGGLILGVFSWHVIFFVNLPLGVIGTFMVFRFVPREVPPMRQTFDVPGALSMFTGLLCFLLAITLGPHLSFTSPSVLGLGAASAVALTLFVRRELSVEHPLVDLGMFRNSTLSTNVVTGVIVFVAGSGLVFLLPFFLQSMQGRTPREAGLLLVTSPLMLGLSSPISGWLSDHVGFRPLTVLGLSVLAVAYLLVSTLGLETTSFGFVARIMWVGIGMGLFQSPNNSAIMGSVPRERLGVASGLLSLTRTVGQTTGIALIGACWAALVQHLDVQHVTDAMSASLDARLAALRWVARAIALMLCVALGIALSSWRRQRVTRSEAV